jgi:hypothetical protein
MYIKAFGSCSLCMAQQGTLHSCCIRQSVLLRIKAYQSKRYISTVAMQQLQQQQ